MIFLKIRYAIPQPEAESAQSNQDTIEPTCPSRLFGPNDFLTNFPKSGMRKKNKKARMPQAGPPNKTVHPLSSPNRQTSGLSLTFPTLRSPLKHLTLLLFHFSRRLLCLKIQPAQPLENNRSTCHQCNQKHQTAGLLGKPLRAFFVKNRHLYFLGIPTCSTALWVHIFSNK